MKEIKKEKLKQGKDKKMDELIIQLGHSLFLIRTTSEISSSFFF